MPETNQHPEQQARDAIDRLLADAGWQIQSKDAMNVFASPGVAVRELQTTEGPADYVLFVDGEPVGIIEAKREEEGVRLTTHEAQTDSYRTSPIKLLSNDTPLRFGYESTGTITRFTDYHDPRPRSRPVFAFHAPVTLQKWLAEATTLRARLHDIPTLDATGLRACQFRAINNLDDSFRDAKPRALVQMATGAGKTFTAITAIYRLLKFAKARRVLFLVDTRNLGEQAEQEFMAYQPADDNRKFTDLYKVQRLTSRFIAPDANVCISTIQRMYSILKGEELAAEDEQTNPAERALPNAPMPVAYNPAVPPELFDFLIIDECHRSIYNVWQQVLEYFDAFQIGLTATPDKRTFGYFKENVVSEYPYEESVADGVNVGFDIYRIETEVTQNGGVISKGEGFVEVREKLSRKQRWQQQDEDTTYDGRQLDRDVVNHSQIRTIIKTFKDRLPTLFPGRSEVPKTLVFAKDDSHADDIVQIIREEFGEGNAFCKKITYKATEDPKNILAQLRNDYNPRIAVTVDMIATGTDVKPLECLIFMRDVRSKNYFEQMKGRGCRSISTDDLVQRSPSATLGKAGFVIVDAVGVTQSIKTDSRPLERKRAVPLKDLLFAIALGKNDEDTFTSVAGRLARLNTQLTPQQRSAFTELAGGKPIENVTHALLAAHNPDVIEDTARSQHALPASTEPSVEQKAAAQKQLTRDAAKTFTPELRDFVENARKALDQIIDNQNLDTVRTAAWDEESVANAEQAIQDFRTYIEQHKDEITALRIFYDQPYRLRELTYDMVRAVLDRLKTDQPALAPARVWNAYAQVESTNPGAAPKQELVALVSLLRRVVGLDEKLTSFDSLVRHRFQDWVFKQHAGDAPKFTTEQMHWLQMIRDHIATSFHVEPDDLERTPFDGLGGLGKFYKLFGPDYEAVLNELNERLVA
ncbi:MAG: type I restriction-modification enzyme R subunit C-terminal domain-containing protein [Phycisphaeraceae bacterium]